MRKLTTYIAAGLLGVALGAQADGLATETFDTAATTAANGWTGSGNTAGGNNFGWSDTGNVLGSAGEAGGVFARSTSYRYFADTSIEIWNRASTVLRMAGSFKLTDQNFDGMFYIGYFKAGDEGANFVGLRITEPSSGGNPFRGYLEVKGSGGVLSSVISLPQNSLLTFDLTWTGNTDGSGSLGGTVAGSSVNLNVAAGTGTFDAFGLLCGGLGTDNANLTANAYFDNLTYDKSVVTTPPSVEVQPADAMVYEGQTAVFSVTASGSPPLFYQWHCDNVAIGGATASSYTTPVTTMDDSGKQFKVTVTNAYGTVTSGVATLTVMAPPAYKIVADGDGRYMGWPANNGSWSWDNGQEILVGYSDATYDPDGGFHPVAPPYLCKLARSLDGGNTWVSEDPDNFVGDGCNVNGEVPEPSPGNINFGHPDFAMRVMAHGVRNCVDTDGRFWFSYDRGKTWNGSYTFNGLRSTGELAGLEITSRTSYLVTGANSALIFKSARNLNLPEGNRRDKPFVAETTDGGTTFNFITWIVPWTDDYRAVMPSTVRTTDGSIIVALRRRNPFDISSQNWIDTYVSVDNGRNWSFLSKVADTGVGNGNPPGLALLADGRLACSYANRDRRQMLVRYSSDNGQTWSEEIVIRDNPHTEDIGYPQMVQNADGDMVMIYYLATEENPSSYIEAAIFEWSTSNSFPIPARYLSWMRGRRMRNQ